MEHKWWENHKSYVVCTYIYTSIHWKPSWQTFLADEEDFFLFVTNIWCLCWDYNVRSFSDNALDHKKEPYNTLNYQYIIPRRSIVINLN